MKIIEINRQTVTHNLKKNYKISIIILLISLVVGLCWGLFQYTNYSYEKIPYSGENNIDVSAIEGDGSYYFDAFDSIQTEADYLDLYFRYLHVVSLSHESMDTISAIENSFYEFYDGRLQEDIDYYWNTPLCAVDGQNTITVYEEKIHDLEGKKNVANEKWELLREADHTEAFFDGKQLDYEQEIAGIDEYIGKFQNLNKMIADSNSTMIESNNNEADKLIEEDVQILNGIIDDFNAALKSVAEKEQYEIIYNKHVIETPKQYIGLLKTTNNAQLIRTKKNEAYIYARSLEGPDQKQDRFMSVFTFFILFGIVLAVIVGAVYSGRKSNREE